MTETTLNTGGKEQCDFYQVPVVVLKKTLEGLRESGGDSCAHCKTSLVRSLALAAERFPPKPKKIQKAVDREQLIAIGTESFPKPRLNFVDAN